MVVTKSFDQRDIAAKHDFRGANYEPPMTVTAKERLDLMRERAKPTPQQHLRPKQFNHAQQQSAIERMRERRINHIETRLLVTQAGMQRDQRHAFNQGRAKASFDKASQSNNRSQSSSHERTK